jgi:hypothetical protein
MYRSYSFMILELEGGEWSTSLDDHALTLGDGPTVPIGQRVGWAPEPVWTQRLKGKLLFYLLGIERQFPGHPVHSQTLLIDWL